MIPGLVLDQPIHVSFQYCLPHQLPVLLANASTRRKPLPENVSLVQVAGRMPVSMPCSSIAFAVAVSCLSPAFLIMLQSPKNPTCPFPLEPLRQLRQWHVSCIAEPRPLGACCVYADIDLQVSRLSLRRLGRPFCLLLFFCRSRIGVVGWSFHRCLRLAHVKFFGFIHRT